MRTGGIFYQHGIQSNVAFLEGVHIETQRTVAIRPEQLEKKCIHLKLESRHFVFEMPCKFHGD